MNDRIKNVSLLMGLTLLVFTAAAFVVPSLSFLVGLSINGAHIFIALAVTAGFLWFTAKYYFPDNYRSYFAVCLALSAALFFIFLAVSGNYYDLSYDGQAYHQEAILRLAQGWNPFYDKPLGEQGAPYAIWIDHYAKGSEICGAVLYALTGKIEMSKVFNFLLILASFFLSFSALYATQRKKWVRAAFLALLLACNPVSIYQCLSFYVDGQLGSILICLVAIGVLIYLQPNAYLIAGFSFCILLVFNNKFTAIAYAGILCFGLVAALYITQKHALLKKMLIVLSATAAIGILILGFNPYVTNTIKYHNPFFPLAGNESRDVVAAFTPISFSTLNRFEQATVSYFSASEENSTERDTTQLKTPFTLKANELTSYGSPDTAIAGFGPLFSGVLVLCLAILAMAFLFNIPRTIVVFGLLAILLGSVFINYAAWWARYVPHLWIIPFVIALLGFSFEERKVIRGLSWLMIAVMFINVTLVSYSYFNLQTEWNQTLKSQLQTLKQSSQPVTVYFSYAFTNKNRLTEYGISFKETKVEPQCGSKVNLSHSGTVACTQ
jgi:hypothetical protein